MRARSGAIRGIRAGSEIGRASPTIGPPRDETVQAVAGARVDQSRRKVGLRGSRGCRGVGRGRRGPRGHLPGWGGRIVAWRRGLRRLATCGLGLIALASGSHATASPPPASGPKVTTVTTTGGRSGSPSTSRRADVPRYKQVQLWSSSDGGARAGGSRTPRPSTTALQLHRPPGRRIPLRGPDGGQQDRLFPADDADVEPNMKVGGRHQAADGHARRQGSGGGRSPRSPGRWSTSTSTPRRCSWSTRPRGPATWAQVPIRKQARIGVAEWDAGTAEPLRVRASVLDKAGNSKVATIALPNGAPSDRNSGGDGLEPSNPPPIGSFASIGSGRSASNRSGPPADAAAGRPPTRPSRGVRAVFDPFGGNESARGRRRPRALPRRPTSRPARRSWSGARPSASSTRSTTPGPNGPAAV